MHEIRVAAEALTDHHVGELRRQRARARPVRRAAGRQKDSTSRDQRHRAENPPLHDDSPPSPSRTAGGRQQLHSFFQVSRMVLSGFGLFRPAAVILAAVSASYPPPKRMLDKALAAALIVLLSPALIAVALAMLADALLVPRDRGALLYREARVSRGRTFELLKFRTLRRDVAGEPRLAERDAANLTWAGRRILKPRYLDELPQLFNVLRG